MEEYVSMFDRFRLTEKDIQNFKAMSDQSYLGKSTKEKIDITTEINEGNQNKIIDMDVIYVKLV